MKSFLKLIFIVSIFIVNLAIHGCDNSLVNEAVLNSDNNSDEINSLAKGKSYDCFGYAVEQTKLEQYSTYLGYIPETEFSTTVEEDDACIIVWQDDEGASDHAAYIIYLAPNGDLTVREYAAGFNPHIQTNTYSYPYDHPLSTDDNVVWYEKDPPLPMTNSISGPIELENNEIGYFSANPKKGAGTYSNYRWWKRNDGSFKGGSKQPPVGEWIELDEFEGDKSIRQAASFNFSLKCIAYDVWGNSAKDIHSITIE